MEPWGLRPLQKRPWPPAGHATTLLGSVGSSCEPGPRRQRRISCEALALFPLQVDSGRVTGGRAVAGDAGVCGGRRAAEAMIPALRHFSFLAWAFIGTSWEAGPTPPAGRPPALGHLGPRAAPKSHCPLDLGCQADCEVPLGVGGWALAALWILQAPTQPALSRQPLSAAPPGVQTRLIHPSASVCPQPDAASRSRWWVVPQWAGQGSGTRARAREGRWGAWDLGGLVGVDPAMDPGCPQHAGQLLPRERLKGVKARGSPFFPSPSPTLRCINHGSLIL